MRSAALSDVGLVRTRNEDAYWCDGDRGIFVVADVTGVTQSGETAAATAVEIISTELTLAVDRGLSDLPLADAMHDAFREASTEVFRRAQEPPEGRDLSCSAVACVVTKSECMIAHAGDARAYLLADDGLHQITLDDTPVAVMVKRGYLLPEKARTHGTYTKNFYCNTYIIEELGATRGGYVPGGAGDVLQKDLLYLLINRRK